MARTKATKRRYNLHRNQAEARKIKKLAKESAIKEAIEFDRKPSNDPNEYLHRYKNMCEITQLWILQDQKRINANKTTTIVDTIQDETIALLHTLPDDLKYVIIDFIPTISKRPCWKKIDHVDNNSEMCGLPVDEMLSDVVDPLNPKVLDKRRRPECLYEVDGLFKWFHKMRLISKEYALRMKQKILTFPSLDISCLDIESFTDTACYVVSLLRAQRLHSENKSDMSNPLIYQDIDVIKGFSTKSEEEPIFEDEYGSEDFKSTYTTPVEHNFMKENSEMVDDEIQDHVAKLLGETSKVHKTNFWNAESDSEEDEYYSDNEIDYKAVPTSYRHFKKFYANTCPVELVNAKSLERVYDPQRESETVNISFETLSTYVGQNTVLTTLVIGSTVNELIMVLHKCCTSLLNITGFDVSMLEVGNNSVRTLKLMGADLVCIDEAADYVDDIQTNYPKCSNFVIEVQGDTVEVSDFINNDMSSTKKINMFVDGTLIKSFNQRARGETLRVDIVTAKRETNRLINDFDNLRFYSKHPNDLISAFFQDFFESVQHKQLVDALFRDRLIPIEACDIFDNYSKDDPVAQYLIYLANTYQNGRLFSTLNDSGNFSWALSLGWKAELDELVFDVSGDTLFELLGYLKTKYDDVKFAKLIRSVMLNEYSRCNCVTYLRYVNENLSSQKELIFAPVKCIFSKSFKFDHKYVHIPFASLFFNKTDTFYGQYELVNSMTPEQLLYQNENGDTFLHVCEVQNRYDSSDLIFDIIFQKQPKLAHVVNAQGRSLLHMFTKRDSRSAIVYRLITTYNANPELPDIYGEKPFDKSSIKKSHFPGLFK